MRVLLNIVRCAMCCVDRSGDSDSWLWLLAEDRHCGRLIGIAGKHFNAIKEKTNAAVIVGKYVLAVHSALSSATALLASTRALSTPTACV